MNFPDIIQDKFDFVAFDLVLDDHELLHLLKFSFRNFLCRVLRF